MTLDPISNMLTKSALESLENPVSDRTKETDDNAVSFREKYAELFLHRRLELIFNAEFHSMSR